MYFTHDFDMPRKLLPKMIDNALHLPVSDGAALPPIIVGSAAWFVWLEDQANHAFSAATSTGSVTIRRERQSGGFYWYAYQRHGPKLRKAYVGKTADATAARLLAVFETLAQNGEAAIPVAGGVRINLLGTPQIIRSGTSVDLPASKAVALLAYLALASAPQSRSHLLALLWPESAQEAARKNLRNLLWTIRTALGEDVLLGQNERLALQPTVSVDVREFERLVGGNLDGGRQAVDGEFYRPPSTVHRQSDTMGATLQNALALYRGPLLLGINLVEAADFDLWVTAERERLAHRFSRAAEQLITMQRDTGEWEGVISVAQQVLSLDPLQEWPYRALMEAHARHGDRATALRQYELLRAMLDHELDAAPAPETEAVHDAIVRGAVSSNAPSLQRAPVRMAQHAPGPFVGRSAERAMLDGELAAARNGVRMAVVSGEMGIGKSRLWQVWAAGISPDIAVLEARCLVSTQPMPFAPLIGLFSQRIVLERFSMGIDGAQAAWLEDVSPLLPSLQETLARPPLLSRLQPADERQRVFEAFVQALQAIAPPPLVLFLDDLQWADAATLDWLDYLVHRGRDLALLLVLAYRSEDAPRSLLQRIAQWDRDRLVCRLPLERLNEPEAVALLDALRTTKLTTDEQQKPAILAVTSSPLHPFTSSAKLTQLYQASAGNPFFLTELAAAPAGNLPPALTDLVRAKIDRLPEVAQQVVQAAAVLEPDLDTATIWRIAGRDENDILDAIDALLQAAILIEQADRYLFAHPLVAAIVREDMSRARRATLHRRAATALEQLYADRLPAQAGRIMAHFREAGDRRQMAGYAELAGDYALTVAAPDEATTFYNQAIAVEATAARLFGLGRTQIWRGDLAAAADTLQQARQRFSETGDPIGAAWTALQLADLGTMQNQYTHSMELAEQALALAGANSPAIAAAAHVLIATGLRIGGAPLVQAEAHLNQAIQIASEINLPDVLTYCHVGLSNIRAEQGDMQAAFEAAEAIVRYAKLAGNDFYQAVGYNNAAYRALLLGNLAAAYANLQAGLRLVEERALEVPRQWLYSTRGELALVEHDWDAATDWFRRGIKAAEHNHNRVQVAMYHANLGLAARGRGNLAEAIQLLEQARSETARETAGFQQTQIDLWLAETYFQYNQHTQAGAALRRAETSLAGGSFQQLHPAAEALRLQGIGVKGQGAEGSEAE